MKDVGGTKIQSMVSKSFIFLSLVVSCSTFEFSFGPPSPSTQTNIPKAYAPHFRPNYGAVADMLSLSIDALRVNEIDEKRMKVYLDFTLRTSWTDPRLVYAVNKSTTFVNNFPYIWIPDLYIVDGKRSETPTQEMTQKSLTFKPQGQVILNQRHVAEVQCLFSFVKFPFDRQECGIKFKSFSYTTIHLDMVWNGQVDESRVELFDSDFKLSSIDLTSEKESSPEGEFRILQVVVRLRRNIFGLIKVVILPGILLTFLSYLTLFFVRGEEATTSRQTSNPVPFSLSLIRTILSIVVLIVYQLITQIFYVHSPEGSTFTGMDVWIWFIFSIQLTLLLFNGALLVTSKRNAPDTTTSEKTKPGFQRIEKLLIPGIPLLTIVFLIIYFIVYLI